MMRYGVLLFLLNLLTVKINAQHRLSNWVFADSVGINFDLNGLFETVMHANSPFGNNVSEASACISSNQGDLLLYSNGDGIWNANGQLIVDSLNGYNSSSNGVIIIPSISDSNQYLVFSNFFGLYVTTVDLSLNGGEGGAIAGMKNILLVDDTLDERVTAIRHANGRDWWILASGQFTNGHYIFLYSPQGIQLIQEQFIGSLVFNPLNPMGEISCSTSGNLVATCSGNAVSVFDFDRCSGVLSNFRHHTTGYNSQSTYYGCSISPDGSKLYFSNWDTLFQSTITNDSLSSPVTIWIDTVQTSPDSSYSLGQHELAPDGKIYISYMFPTFPNNVQTYFNRHLCLITKPDFAGLSCDFQPWAFDLNGNRVLIGLPNMPNYNLGALVGSACETLTSTSTVSTKSFEIEIYPNPATDVLHYQSAEPVSRITAYDVLGRAYKLESTSTKSALSLPNVSLDIHELPSGIYNIEFITRNNIYTQRFVKESIW